MVPGWIVLFIAQMIAHLGFQCPLQHRLGQLFEQPVFPNDLLGVLIVLQQLIDQRIVDSHEPFSFSHGRLHSYLYSSGSTVVSECCAAPADGSVAYRPSRSSARSCVRSIPRAGGVSSYRTRPAPVAGFCTPPAARRVDLASRAVLSASSRECRCAPHNFSSAAPLRHCGSPCPSPVLRSLAGEPSACPGAVTRPRVASVLPPAHPPRITFHPASSYLPGRRLAASRPRWRPCPDPPRVRPCALSESARLSSSRSARPGLPDSATLCSMSASCVYGPAAPDPPASAS